MLKLEWRTEQRKVNDLIPFELNPRKITADNQLKLVKSLGKFNLVEIPAVNADYTLLSGHQRIKVLQMVGRGDELIDIRVPNRLLTEAEVKEYNLISNTHAGEFDLDALLANFSDVDFDEIGLDLPDFGPIVNDTEAPEVKDDEYEIPVHVKTDIVSGDLFEIGPHKLLCGDSRIVDNWAKLCQNRLIDMVQTDPPYNVDYVGGTADALTIKNDKMDQSAFYQFLLDAYSAIGAYLKPGGVWYVWHSDSEGHNFRRALIETGNKLTQTLIWVKNSLVMSRQDYHWMHEPCLYGWKLGAGHNWFNDRTQTTVLRFDRPQRNADHPTMKPIPLIAYQICNSTIPGQIVADGFGGSGTTMVASHQTHRTCYMMEDDPKYCQVIINRMMLLDPSLVIMRNGVKYEPSN